MTDNATEVERKWLVKDLPKLVDCKKEKIIQGYIVASAKGEVRVRQKGARFFQTVKTGTGLQRGETEIELSKKQFRKLWPLTKTHRLEKIRYSLKWKGGIVELDVYRKKLSGLRIAEVEFETRSQAKKFKAPAWFGEDVTNKNQYKNANLAARQKRPKVRAK